MRVGTARAREIPFWNHAMPSLPSMTADAVVNIASSPAFNFLMRSFQLSTRFTGLICTGVVLLAVGARAELPPLPPFPDLPPVLPEDSVPSADSKSADEVKLDLPVTPGPFAPTWESIEKNYPGTPS